MNHAPSDAELAQADQLLTPLRRALNEVLFDQEELIDLTLTALLARGHVLLEGLPGLGKTELVKGLARLLGLDTKRLQFTPDLLPGDITGNPILQESEGHRRFVFHPGPLFANLVLADEINRASPKTQSALLEAMQEGHVTVLGEAHRLPAPFLVLDTQNPLELEGTYPLPEAQLDRFLFKLLLQPYQAETLQRIILQRHPGEDSRLEPVLMPVQLQELFALTRRIHLPEVVANYIARLIHATQPGASDCAALLSYGAGPRAALSLATAARARALLQNRPNASFEDVQALAHPV
ncbi:MAG: AAA family ATPase, partial [Verrucomicrobiales bacterium]